MRHHNRCQPTSYVDSFQLFPFICISTWAWVLHRLHWHKGIYFESSSGCCHNLNTDSFVHVPLFLFFLSQHLASNHCLLALLTSLNHQPFPLLWHQTSLLYSFYFRTSPFHFLSSSHSLFPSHSLSPSRSLFPSHSLSFLFTLPFTLSLLSSTFPLSFQLWWHTSNVSYHFSVCLDNTHML